MHDPCTLVHTIRFPFSRREFISIWHHDPEKDGTDDSCGWFKRARHGDPECLERIVKRFEFDWDRVFKSDDSGHVYFCGYFCPNGDPHFSVQGIVLNLFLTAASEHFQCDGTSNWKKSRAWVKRYLADIMLFAENPTDSLFDGITRKFEIGCGEKHDKRRRDERVRSMAASIYGWILRSEQKWWQHPTWHIHHWRLQIHPLQRLKRFLFERCAVCGGRFKAFGNESVCGNWEGNKIWHDRCSQHKVPIK